MSFDINPPSQNLSNIQASSKTTDGGAGNTGYFQRGKKSKEEEKKYGIAFKPESELDSFEHKTDEEEQTQQENSFSFLRFIEDLIYKIKALIFGGKKSNEDGLNKNV